MDCIFCKIVKNEIPNYTVYENDAILAFLDIHPMAKGHTVVVPKKHFELVFEMNDSDLCDLMIGVKRAMERIQKTLQPDGFNIGWNSGKAGGQAVAHLHMHIVPRRYGDGGGSMHSIVRNQGDVDVVDVARLFT